MATLASTDNQLNYALPITQESHVTLSMAFSLVSVEKRIAVSRLPRCDPCLDVLVTRQEGLLPSQPPRHSELFGPVHGAGPQDPAQPPAHEVHQVLPQAPGEGRYVHPSTSCNTKHAAEGTLVLSGAL